jgi:hypothetical protein
LIVKGADTDINGVLCSKGAGGVGFATGSGSTQQFNITHTASAVNYLQVTGSATGTTPIISAQGSDATVSLSIQPKGSNGYVNIGNQTNNYFQLYPNSGAGGPTFWTWGSDTDVPLNIATKGAGNINFKTNSGANNQFVISSTASAVNYVQVTGSVAGASVALSAQGTDGNIGFILRTKGSGAFTPQTEGTYFQNLSAQNQMAITNTASAVNYLSVYGAVTGGGPAIQANGTDPNVNINYWTKATGAHIFATGHAAYYPQVVISHTNAAVNPLYITGGVTGSGPVLSAQGSDTNVDLYLTAKGNGRINVASRMIVGNAAAANYYSVLSQYDGLIVANTITGGAIGFGGNNGRSLSAYQNNALSNFDFNASQVYYSGDLLVQGQIKTPNSTSANLQITTTDANATIFINRTVYIANANSSISNATGALILAGGMGITGNLFMSGANNFSATTSQNSYRLGWTDNYFMRNPVYNGMDFNGNYLNINNQFITTGALSIRNIVNNDSGNNTIIFSGQSGLLVQNGSSVAVNVGGGAVIGTSSANYLRFSGNTTGNPVSVSSVGSDANVNLNLVTQGSGTFSFLNSNTTN